MLAYAAAWLAFGAIHSLSSREPAKAELRRLAGRAMRLCWNILAIAELAAVLAIGHAAITQDPFDRPIWLAAAQAGLIAAGVAVLALATRSYDIRRFLGLAQLRGTIEDDEPFRADGLLAFVRHPLYLGGLLLLAGLVRDTQSLQTALYATLYILVGLRFEERALIRRFGETYIAYRARVPALLPWRGRAWPPGTIAARPP